MKLLIMQFLHHRVTATFLGPNILFSYLLSNILTLLCYLKTIKCQSCEPQATNHRQSTLSIISILVLLHKCDSFVQENDLHVPESII
jgi:hypothetical protein